MRKPKQIKSKTLSEIVPTLRMSWETYAYLKSLIEDQKNKLKRDFQTACNFIPIEVIKGNKPSGRDKAHKVFSDAYSKLDKMEAELHTAAQATYADHPNPEMRKFWGIAS